jgi:AraC-like DNA-binding protein
MTGTSSSARVGGGADVDQPTRANGSADPTTPDGYHEYLPAPALLGYVECFWSSTPGAGSAGRMLRILPDGCVDIVLEFGPAREVASVVGTMTRPLVTAANEHSRFVGVRFRPGVAHAVFGVPAAQLTDLRPPLADLWHDAEAAFDEARRAADVIHRVRAVERVLVRRLGPRPAPPVDIGAAVRMITRARGNLSIAALGPALGVTRQHLARCFARDVGVSPKMFARVTRMRAVVATVGRATHAPVDWSRVALETGYCDQSHLVQDFKALTGLTPGDWAATR